MPLGSLGISAALKINYELFIQEYHTVYIIIAKAKPD